MKVCFDNDLLVRYGGRGPRYTSYPTALQFTGEITADRYRSVATASNPGGVPLSLYVHIPFCHSLCYYCGCNKISYAQRGAGRSLHGDAVPRNRHAVRTVRQRSPD